MDQKNSNLWTKSPTIFALVVFIHLISIFSLSIKTETYLFSTNTATIEEDVLVVQGEVNIIAEQIYIYSEKNSTVIKDRIICHEYLDGNTYIYISGNEDFLQQNGSKSVTVEIPAEKTTLFNRLFINGGKINE